MDGRSASFSEADPLLSRAHRLLAGSIDGSERSNSTCAEDPLSQHGAPSLDWRLTTPPSSADASSSLSEQRRPPIELHRIAVIMCAYGFFYTLLAGNQTVAALAAVSAQYIPSRTFLTLGFDCYFLLPNVYPCVQCRTTWAMFILYLSFSYPSD